MKRLADIRYDRAAARANEIGDLYGHAAWLKAWEAAWNAYVTATPEIRALRDSVRIEVER